MRDSLKNVPLKKRVIVRTNLFESILEITHFLSGTFFKESRNLYPRRGRGSSYEGASIKYVLTLGGSGYLKKQVNAYRGRGVSGPLRTYAFYANLSP